MLNRNLVLLVICQCLAFSVPPMMMLIGSLIGASLSSNAQQATLPIAAMVVGTAVATAPAVLLMRRYGRKPVLIGFMLFGALNMALLYQALAWRSFLWFCVGSAGIGAVMAAVAQFRFVAMESVPLAKATAAASWVLLGGVVAANLGPELAVAGRYLTAVEYQGSFILVAGCLVLVAGLLFGLTPVVGADITPTQPPRPLRQMLQNPLFWLAVMSGTVGFAVMTGIMTATPISMHHHHGHSLEDTKWVIQSHITAMFLPSLVAPLIARWLGLQGMMLAGLVAYAACVWIGSSSQSVMAFWGSLVLLGVGWNFLFVAGTALLPTTYRAGEQFKAQAINEAIVYSVQAIASLSAGWALAQIGWQSLPWWWLPLCLLPIALMLISKLSKTPKALEQSV